MAVLCIDVGGTYIKSALADGSTILRLPKIPTPRNSLDEFIRTISTCFNQQKTAAGIAMCSPGIIDENTGFMHTGGSLHYIRELDMPALLSEACGGIPVTVSNDAKSSARAELEIGCLQNVSHAIILVIGTALGGAVIHERKVISGYNHFAGEFSYVDMGSPAPGQAFTPWGSWGSSKIAEIYASKIHSSPNLYIPENVFSMAENHDRDALFAIEKYCETIIPHIINLQCVIDPEVIAIGGGISEQPLFLEILRTKMAEHQANCQRQAMGIPNIRLEACRYPDNTMGAYLSFAKKYPRLVGTDLSGGTQNAE